MKRSLRFAIPLEETIKDTTNLVRDDTYLLIPDHI